MNTQATLISANRAFAQLLLVQVAAAHTLLDLAAISSDSETAWSKHCKAVETLDTIRRLRNPGDLDPQLRKQLEIARSKLEARLQKFETERR